MIDEKLFQMLISFVVAPLVAFVGKVIFDRINRNEQTVKELKAEMESKYQSKELAHEVNRGIKEKLDDILDSLKEVNQKLDKKADKVGGGTKEDALVTLDTLIASGTVKAETAMSLLPTLQKGRWQQGQARRIWQKLRSPLCNNLASKKRILGGHWIWLLQPGKQVVLSLHIWQVGCLNKWQLQNKPV
ncbi:hypothetical protein POEJIIAE_03029 [Mannheimia haemolytica]